MSDKASLNSAVIYLMENTLELFAPTAETKSAGVRQLDDHEYVRAGGEGDVGGLQGCLS